MLSGDSVKLLLLSLKEKSNKKKAISSKSVASPAGKVVMSD